MEEKLIYGYENSLKLVFLDAFHPSKVHIKADHWNFRYKLRWINSSSEFEGYFTGKFWSLNGETIIVLEKYANDNFDEETIEYDADIKRKLLLIDLKKSRLTEFSSAFGGHFKIIELTEKGIIIYEKLYPDMIKEFEVDLNDLRFEYFEKNKM